MPNGGPEHLQDLPWWREIGAALAAAIMFLVGRSRGRTSREEDRRDSVARARESRQIEADRLTDAIHELLEEVRLERREHAALLREEQKALRQVLYTAAKDLTEKLSDLDKSVAKLLDRGERRGGG